MQFDFEKFCLDFRIDTAPRSHQHSRQGWINVECPFCSGHKGWHLGWCIKDNYFRCYRCGWHPIEKVIGALSHLITDREIWFLLKKYQGESSEDLSSKEDFIRPENITYPAGTTFMTERHKNYLRSRDFDPDKLEKQWGLLGTDHLGEYRFRILAPITFKGKVVSFQCRDITDKQTAKYLPCQKEQEVVPYKHLLYGWDQVPASVSSCIVVEGITGVWRLGPGSLCTFGVEYTASQLRLLASRFERIFTLFDPDMAGDKAEKMVNELRALGREAEQFEITLPDFDSGNIPQAEADKLMKEAIR